MHPIVLNDKLSEVECIEEVHPLHTMDDVASWNISDTDRECERIMYHLSSHWWIDGKLLNSNGIEFTMQLHVP